MVKTVLVDTTDVSHHKRCPEKCGKVEGKMLKCLNLTSITGAPCPGLIHVECSEYSEELAALLKVYYCEECTNLKDDLHEQLKAAELEANELLEKSKDEGKVSLKDYKALEELAKTLNHQLSEKVDMLEGQQYKIETLESKVNEFRKMIADQAHSKVQIDEHNEKRSEPSTNDSFSSVPNSELGQNQGASSVFDQLNDTIRRASKIKPHHKVTFSEGDLNRSVSSVSSRITIGFPNYAEQEAKARALTDQSLLLLRASVAIQPFKGDTTRWSMFVSDFVRTSSKGHYKAHEDMERLRDLIQGEANEMFLLELSDPFADPIAILKRLERFYNVRGSAVRVALDNITQLTRIEKPNDKQRLKALYISAKQFALQCDIHDQKSELSSESILYILESKMCSEHKSTWREWTKQNQMSDDTDGIIAFLEEQIRELNLKQNRRPQSTITSAVNFTDMTGGQSSSDSKRNESSIPSSSSTSSSSKPRRQRRNSANKREVKKRRGDVACFHCKENHPVYKCPKFCSLEHQKKIEVVTKLNICKRCLCTTQHEPDDCSFRLMRCRVEGCVIKNTHPLLHGHAASEIPSFIHTNFIQQTPHAHFPVVPGHVIGVNGERIETTLLIDTGCGSSLATMEIFEKAKYPCVKEYELTMKYATEAIHVESEAKLFSLSFLPLGGKKPLQLENITAVTALDLPMQAQQADTLKKSYEYLQNIPIPSYGLQRPQVLLGLSHVGFFTPLSTITGPRPEDPVAALTKLGWVVLGNLKDNKSLKTVTETSTFGIHVVNCHPREITNDELMEFIRSHYELESIGIGAENCSLLSKDQARAKELCGKLMNFNAISKRYEVGLIWNNPSCEMPDNYSEAVQRLGSTERRLAKLKMQQFVIDHFKAQIADGLLMEVTREEVNNYPRRNYVYGFLTFNLNKKPPKPRWVNDTASTFRGISLNTSLLNGPDNLTPLPQAMCVQREGKVAYQADVKSMFNQVEMKFEDQFSQLVLWRDCDASQQPRIYRQARVIFGPKCSPFLTGEVRIAHAKNSQEKYPEAAEAALYQMYVDDVTDSRSSIEEAVKVANDLIKMFDEISWPLVEFQSNSQEFLNRLPPGNVSDKMVEIGSDHEEFITKVLGIFWKPKEDVYVYRLNDDSLVNKILKESHQPTKREMLSVVMRMFDPTNQIAPFRIRGHMILQKVWRAGTDWNKKPPMEIIDEYVAWLRDFDEVTKLKIPRWYAPVNLKDCELTLHIFVDAGVEAYAAAAYMHVRCKDTIFVRLIAAKARVAPIKYASIPRLELMSAVLGARLLKTVIAWHRRLTFVDYLCWTDSDVSFKWITSHHLPRTAFTAPRIAEIQDLTSADKWRYVPTKLNVADYATKDRQMPYSDSNHEWYIGPAFLYESTDKWPKQPTSGKNDEVVLMYVKPIISKTPWQAGIIAGVSSSVRADWRTFVQVVAKALRVADFIKKEKHDYKDYCAAWEFERAENFIFRCMQREVFSEEFLALQKGRAVSSLSPIYCLAPYLCPITRVIRATTRLSSNFPFNMRCPVILPNLHEVTDAIVRFYHLLNLHVSDNSIIAATRARVWIINARGAIRRCRARCTYCIDKKARVIIPSQADIPDFRLDINNKPFFHCGIDLFGPIEVYTGRSKCKSKIWVAIFTCMVTRAVYFEVVNDQSTECFLTAFEKLWARRGPIKHVYTDNGGNFVGAANIFEADLWQRTLVEKKIVWHFSPAYTPQFGGAWERLIKDVKRGLDSSIGKFIVPRNSLESALAKIEANLNNRPLTDLPLSPSDDAPLTPYLLMTGHPNYPASHESVSSSLMDPKEIRKIHTALRVNSLVQAFRKRFITEYAPIITRRNPGKGNAKTTALKLNDYVIYLDPTKNPSEWPKGVISKIYPGRDKKVRVADIRLKEGHILARRSIYRVAKIDLGLENPEAQQQKYTSAPGIALTETMQISLSQSQLRFDHESENINNMADRSKNYRLDEEERLIHLDSEGSRTVYCSNFPATMGARQVKLSLETYGSVATITSNNWNGVSEFNAFVTFTKEEFAHEAIRNSRSIICALNSVAHTIVIEKLKKKFNPLKFIKNPAFTMFDKEARQRTLAISPGVTSKLCLRSTMPIEGSLHGLTLFVDEEYQYDFDKMEVSQGVSLDTLPVKEKAQGVAVNVVEVIPPSNNTVVLEDEDCTVLEESHSEELEVKSRRVTKDLRVYANANGIVPQAPPNATQRKRTVVNTKEEAKRLKSVIVKVNASTRQAKNK